MHRNRKLAASAIVFSLILGLNGRAIALERPGLDRAMTAQASPAARSALDRAMADPVLRAVGPTGGSTRTTPVSTPMPPR